MIRDMFDWIENNILETIVIAILVIALVCLGAILGVTKESYKVSMDTLEADNQRLTLDLADRENEIYELTLEIKSTNKTLAETANELDRLVKETTAREEILHLDYVGVFDCTAYCCEKYPHICGTGSGKTASGTPVTADLSCAVADLETFPYGTIIYIESVGIRVVQDTGGFKANRIDCAVDTHKHASNWEGQGRHNVYIINTPALTK